jgi:hypothetical protein
MELVNFVHLAERLGAASTSWNYTSISSFAQPGFFCKITKPSKTCANGMYSSVASSALSVVPKRTGV